MGDPVWSAFSRLAFLNGRRVSARELQAAGSTAPEGDAVLVAAGVLKEAGFDVEVLETGLSTLAQARLPILLLLKSGEPVIWVDRNAEEVTVWLPASTDSAEGRTEQWPLSRLRERYAGTAVTAIPNVLEEARRAGDAASTQPHWFWGVFRLLRRHYGDCAVAAVLINLLALAGSMFSMNVYDRVIPNGATHTLWVLAIGVGLAAVLEFGLRTLRSHLVDEAGKRADLLLSAAIFRQTLGLLAKDRPSSSGQFAGTLRDFDSVREFVSSTTLIALADLPFVLLFLAVIALLGGSLVLLPFSAAILILVVGVLAQLPIRRSVERYQYENSQKLAYMVETFERLETIQALNAVPAVQGRWERLCAVAARSGMESRTVSAAALNLTALLQQLASTGLILWGVYLILDGKMTVGGLIGCSILAGRALAPMAQITGLMTRWQQARLAYRMLDRIMGLERQYDLSRTGLQIGRARGELDLEDVEFSYPRSEQRVLAVRRLHIPAGDTVAVMGPVGSGKSTLLRLLAALQPPGKGRYLLDGIDSAQVATADLRAQISWVSQDAVLFRGTLRDNLLLGMPQVSEARFQEVLRLTGVLALANRHPHGLDMQVGEGGQMLSGGQRQMVALARALLSDTPVVLLDEPTSAFDAASEQRLLSELKTLLAGRTLIVATHRPAPLELVRRLVVLDAGQVVADGPRDVVLKAVQDGQVRRAGAVTLAAAGGG